MATPPRGSLPALETQVGYWLWRVSNQASSAFARALADNGITVAEWVALRLVHGEAGRTPTDLTTATGMTRGAASKVLGKLESKGLVARGDHPSDGRIQLLSLTRKGANLVPKLAAIAEANDARFFGRLEAREQAELRRLLTKLAEAHAPSGQPAD